MRMRVEPYARSRMTSHPAIAPVSCFVTMVSSTRTPPGWSSSWMAGLDSKFPPWSGSPCFFAYGGSAKMRLKRAPDSVSRRNDAKASAFVTRPPRSLPRLRFSSITRQAPKSCSMNNASRAPLLKASSPMAPDPANRSSTRASSTTSPMIENTASRTRSVVGRATAAGTLIAMLPAVPEMMRILDSGYWKLGNDASVKMERRQKDWPAL